MKREMRRSGAQANYTQRNSLQGTYNKEAYNSHRKQYQGHSSDYYMYTANAVARDYVYEEETQQQVRKKTKVVRRPALAQHLSTLLVVFLLGMALVVQYAYIQNLGYEVSQAKTELKTVQEQNEKIKKQIASMGELQHVEAVAVYNMGMHKPDNTEVIFLPQQTAARETEEEPALEQAAEQVKEVVGTIMH